MSSIKLRCLLRNGITEIRLLIQHPMDNGRTVDETTGRVKPTHYIEQLTLRSGEHTLIDIQPSTAFSRNPYLTFHYRGGHAGERIEAHWQDNLGQQDSVSALIEQAETDD